jgi:hypothetical protein
MDIKAIDWEDVGWIHPVQDRGQWQAFVNVIVNLWAA